MEGEDGCGSREDGMDKYREAMHMLTPNHEGKVHKDHLKDYFQKTLGTLFDEDMTSAVLDHMKADENGMISVDGFMEAFSTEYWTPENLTMMYDVLENAPHLIKTMVDWKNVLGNLGVELNDEQVTELITKARKCAADLLSAQLSRQEKVKDEGDGGAKKNSKILESILENIHLLKIGQTENQIEEKDQTPESEGDSNVEKQLN